MVMTRAAGTGNDWEFCAHDGSSGVAYYGRNGASLLTVPAITINTWTLLVLTIDSSSGAKFYVNGVVSSTAPGTTALRNANGTVYIGKRSDGNYFKGYMDDLRFYNRALTAQEVLDLYRPGVVIRNAVIRNARINQ